MERSVVANGVVCFMVVAAAVVTIEGVAGAVVGFLVIVRNDFAVADVALCFRVVAAVNCSSN